jgi:hypothetical protein
MEDKKEAETRTSNSSEAYGAVLSYEISEA